MDFTFLFITILMLLAAQSNNLVIAGALFVAMLVSAKKDKYLWFAAFVGGVLALLLTLQFDNKMLVMLGGLFVILLLIVRDDSVHPQAPQMGGGYY